MEDESQTISDAATEGGSAPKGSPERVFARAMTMVLAVWLALACAAPLLTERLGRDAAVGMELAAVASAQRDVVRRMAFDLEAVAGAPDGSDTRVALAALDRDAGRLLELEHRRAAAADGEGGLDQLLAATAGVGELTVQDESRRSRAAELRDLFAARLAPEAARLALDADAEAARRRAAGRLTLAGLVAANLLAMGALLSAVVGPARARIDDWAKASRLTEAENRFRLLHDPLTQLPNAAFLRAHLSQLAAGAARATTHTAVLRLDLDKFKVLRETLGARVSEDILRITARRIRQSLRAGDFAAYLGQDDFVLIATDIEDANAVSGIAQRVQAALTKPFSLQGGARRIGCTIGVAMLGDDRPCADRALANAEIALNEAQAAESSAVRFFRESLRAEAERRETLYAELVLGLERGELIPFFQPQIDLATGRLSGFEALVRWRHPKQGLLAPGAFLDFAEAADLTERIGEAVLTQSLAALNAWDAAGLDVPRVGINFAMAQLRDPRLIEKIKWDVERNDVEPVRISIEVLETVLIKSDADLVVRNLRGLASAGFEIELDDFGTGHASIQNLRRFMVDRIKIDRSFVLGIEDSEEQQTLTSSMIAMARALGIRTLAEGVETAAAEATLRRLGCDFFQGYHIAKPMALADTFDWLAANQARVGQPAAAATPGSGDPNKP